MSTTVEQVKSLYPNASGDGWFSVSDYQPIIDSFGEVLLQVDDHDYQGDSRAILRHGERYGILIFGWGSCSGCDSLQACDSFEEVASLRDRLESGILWFDSPAECLKYISEKDWETDWSWHADETKQFVAQSKELLEKLCASGPIQPPARQA